MSPNPLIDAALQLAATRGWRVISLSDIAEQAEVSLSLLHQHFNSKEAILEGFSHRMDAEVLEKLSRSANHSLSPRDRLFDVLMTRFEVLKPYRLGLAAIAADQACDLGLAVGAWGRLSRTMAWMLEAAGESTQGWAGKIKIKGLTGVYLSALRVFLKDESSDLDATMVALDKAMGRAETWARRMKPGCTTSRAAGQPPGEPSEGAA